jgi:hypothetical protein
MAGAVALLFLVANNRPTRKGKRHVSEQG